MSHMPSWEEYRRIEKERDILEGIRKRRQERMMESYDNVYNVRDSELNIGVFLRREEVFELGKEKEAKQMVYGNDDENPCFLPSITYIQSDMDIYQDKAHETAIYPPERGLEYTALGLAGEAGEYAGLVSKVIRDNNGTVTEEIKERLKSELSDCYWMLAECCTNLGLKLYEVADYNINKLAGRKARGTLGGSGEKR